MKCHLGHKRIIIVMTLCCFSAVAVFSGCEPLRKKFVRKKKAERKAEILPILQPIEYSNKLGSVPGKYSHHYQLWQVWQKEVLTSLEEHASRKKLNFVLNQLIKQLEEMQVLLVAGKTGELSKIIARYRDVLKTADMPDALRSNKALERRVRQIGKDVREKFSSRNVNTLLGLSL